MLSEPRATGGRLSRCSAAPFHLKPGTSVTLHTGKGTNTATNLYWGRSSYVWNNTGDTATLKNAAGTTEDTCNWGSSGSYTNC